MKRTIFLTILFASVLLLSACSTREDFVVINESDGVIEVQYKFKWHGPETPINFVDTKSPAKLSIKEFQKSDRVWRDLPKEQYDFNNLTGFYSVRVAPHEVLLVDFTYNHIGFDLESVKIIGTNGSIKVEGKQVQTQFKLESDTYVIRYR